MSWHIWLVFVPAAFALSMAPGPNNLLAMSNGVRFGFTRAIAGAGGRLAAFAAMILLTAVGLGMLLAASEMAYLVIKWAGAAYLVYLGIRLWFAPAATLDAGGTQAMARISTLARQESLVAAGNRRQS